jgi:hypothetical protein
MFFEEQSERVLIAMIAAPLMAHPDGFIERHLAVSGYPPEDLQRISVHVGLSLLSWSHLQRESWKRELEAPNGQRCCSVPVPACSTRMIRSGRKLLP